MVGSCARDSLRIFMGISSMLKHGIHLIVIHHIYGIYTVFWPFHLTKNIHD